MAHDTHQSSSQPWLWANIGVGFVLGLALSFLSSTSSEHFRPRGRVRRALMSKSVGDDTGWGWAATVDRLGALNEVNGDIPTAAQTGPRGALLLLRENDTEDATGEHIPASCDEVAVIVSQASSGRCLLVAESKDGATYRVSRREHNGDTWRPISRIRESKQRMPTERTRNRARLLAVRLLSKLADVEVKLEPILAEAAKHTEPAYAETSNSKGAVLVMCVNAGNFDLLLNFVLSAQCQAKLDVRNLVVFAADELADDALKAARIATFRHDALGDFSGEAARNYGDHQFVEMMWLKITCVFLVNHLGYDALFQDADLVWWKSPWPYFAERPHIDSFWMDDGARTSRFAPHYPNTGFYLVRSNQRTALLNNQVLGAYAAVLAWQSHQALVSQVLSEAHALYGLTVLILDKELFPSGKQLHHNRPLFERIHSRTFLPYCFHMCWTAGKADKLKFLKQENLWFLPPTCTLRYMLSDFSIIPTCASNCSTKLN